MPRKSDPRKPLVPNPREPERLTELQDWYLECLRLWTAHYGRPPSMPELACYCDKPMTPTYMAMLRIEKKGRVKRNADRKFVIVEVAK